MANEQRKLNEMLAHDKWPNIIHDYQYKRETLAELSKSYRVPKSEIQHYFQANKIKKDSPRVIRSMKRVYNQTHSLAKTAHKFNLSKASVFYIFKNYGVKTDNNHGGKRNKKALYKFYHNIHHYYELHKKGYSYDKLAQIAGIGASTVNNNLKRYSGIVSAENLKKPKHDCVAPLLPRKPKKVNPVIKLHSIKNKLTSLVSENITLHKELLRNSQNKNWKAKYEKAKDKLDKLEKAIDEL